MILETRKLFFKSVFIVFDDDALKNAVKSGEFSSITAISRNVLSLPNFNIKTKTTAVIDLTKSEEEIFAKFNETNRNEIRKTDKLASFRVVAENGDFVGAYSLYKDFERAQGRVPFTKNYFKDCSVFLAYYNGEAISGIFVDKGEKDLRVRCIFSKRLKTEDKELYRIIGHATRRLMWEICLWGKRHIFNSLDLAAVNFNRPEIAGITKFKMSFGGEVVNEYTYTYKSFLFRIFEKLIYIKLSLFRLWFSVKNIFCKK